MLEDSLEERLEKAGGLVPDSEKGDGETREGETEENKVSCELLWFLLKSVLHFFQFAYFILNVQKRSVEGGKQAASLKKLKKDKVAGATAKASRTENSSLSVAPRVKPELALPSMYFLEHLPMFFSICIL